jgi:hypothetical protein
VVVGGAGCGVVSVGSNDSVGTVDDGVVVGTVEDGVGGVLVVRDGDVVEDRVVVGAGALPPPPLARIARP